MLAIFSSFVEREHENFSEWTKAGVAQARGEGKLIGRLFREIRSKMMDNCCQKSLSQSAIPQVMYIPHNLRLAGRALRERNKPEYYR